LRGVGSRFQIIDNQRGDNKGEVDGFRAFKETHPGAVYLHRGDTYLVDALDLEINTVRVTKTTVDYYTRVRAHKNTDILEVWNEKAVWGTIATTGKLRVTEQVTGFERWRIRSKKLINRERLDLPPQTFETEGLWFKIPSAVQSAAESEYMHFMGGIHAIEHASIGMFPLIVMTDRNDLGGISIPLHPQLGCAAVFIYDGIPGGAGLSRQAFSKAEKLLQVTLKAIQTCPCENGCPSCVHSPKCGSGNRPIDKASAAFILEKMKASFRDDMPNHREQKVPAEKPETTAPAKIEEKEKKTVRGRTERKKRPAIKGKAGGRIRKRREKRQRQQQVTLESDLKTMEQPWTQTKRLGVLDLETQYSAQEVGGWHRADLMKISCAVLYDSSVDDYLEFMENEVPRLIQHLKKFDCIVGFNIKRFDYKVLSGYTDFDFRGLPTLDILEEVHKHLGYRLSLNHLANVTLGSEKTGDGLQALRWWKMGKVRELIDYCKEDVRLTLALYRFGSEQGYLLFQNKAGNTVRVPVTFALRA
jgi:DEAD/DEAH box helicase domain-containing protein